MYKSNIFVFLSFMSLHLKMAITTSSWINLFWYLKITAIIITLIGVYKKFFQSRVAAFIISKVSIRQQAFVYAGKVKLFDEAFTKLKRQDNQILRVLEIGAGAGVNFKFYPKNCELIISDKSDAFLPYLHKTMENIKRNDLKILDFVVTDAENMVNVPSNSIDACVATFVQCSCYIPALLKEVQRVLKPGGIFLFMDHSKNFNNTKAYVFQTLIEPIWAFLLDDCRFKDIRTLVKSNSTFETLEIYEYNKREGFLGYITNPILYGYGQKSL